MPRQTLFLMGTPLARSIVLTESGNVPTMSLSSKPKKIKGKGTFRELKIVHTVSRKGYDTTRTEEVKTPRRETKNGSSTSQLNYGSSSPNKRRKLEQMDEEPIPLNLEGPASRKRQTLVFAYSLPSRWFSHNIFQDSKRFVESVLGPRENILEPPPRP